MPQEQKVSPLWRRPIGEAADQWPGLASGRLSCGRAGVKHGSHLTVLRIRMSISSFSHEGLYLRIEPLRVFGIGTSTSHMTPDARNWLTLTLGYRLDFDVRIFGREVLVCLAGQ